MYLCSTVILSSGSKLANKKTGGGMGETVKGDAGKMNNLKIKIPTFLRGF